MDSRQVIARFEAERQALALMDHPNIAKVLDAGATPDGPALLRHGAGQGHPDHPVLRRTAGCRSASGWSCSCRSARRCSTPTRRAIIHRDLKPSNVLVALYDGVPVAEGDRLRRGQGRRPAADRADAGDRLRRGGRHAGVHEPGAGRAEQPRHRHPQRHLLPGRAPVRAADRDDAAAEEAAERGRLRRGAADHPRGGAAAAEHAAEHDRGAALDRGATAARSRAGSAGWCAGSWTGS